MGLDSERERGRGSGRARAGLRKRAGARARARARTHLGQKVILGVELKRLIVHLDGGLARGLGVLAELGGGGGSIREHRAQNQARLQLPSEVDAHDSTNRTRTDDGRLGGGLHLDQRRPRRDLGDRQLRRRRRGGDAAEGGGGRHEASSKESAHQVLCVE